MTNRNDDIKKRITLESLEKKELFTVSKGYFDDLPTKIQKRVVAHEHRSSPAFILSRTLKYALPFIALVVMSIYFGNRFNAAEIDVQALINEVSTEELVAYLTESELSTDEIIALIDIEELDIDGIIDEDISLLDDIELDDILDEYPEYETDF